MRVAVVGHVEWIRFCRVDRMPGPGDICPHDIMVLERPAPYGPFGAKGPGEMCANPLLPVIANAVFAAVGVRINDLPITPEKILRALKARGGAGSVSPGR